jgi:hypothetical protein
MHYIALFLATTGVSGRYGFPQGGWFLHGVQGVASSNPAAPTNGIKDLRPP